MDNISIELSRMPEIYLAFDETWVCGECGGHICLVISGSRTCPGCMMKRSGKNDMVIAGWLLSRSGLGQINANRVITAPST
jgi:hypothetical protein